MECQMNFIWPHFWSFTAEEAAKLTPTPPTTKKYIKKNWKKWGEVTRQPNFLKFFGCKYGLMKLYWLLNWNKQNQLHSILFIIIIIFLTAQY